jgi:hypothetical protein
LLLLLGASLAAAGAAQDTTAQPAEKKPPPVSCGSCHWGGDVLHVQDVWRPGIDAEAAVATDEENHPREAVANIRRSLDTTHDAIKKAQLVLARVETTTDIPLESQNEKVEAAKKKFAKLQEATVSTDQETIEDSAEINLALQKVWAAIERSRDERKSRLAFALLVLITVVFLLVALAGLKRFVPDPVVLPEEGKET